MINKPDYGIDTNSNLTADQIKDYFLGIKGSRKDSFLYLYNLGGEEMSKLQLNNISIKELIPLSGFKGFYLLNKIQFRKWLEWLFSPESADFVKEYNSGKKKEIQNFFFNYLEMSKSESYNYLSNLDIEEIKEARFSLPINGLENAKLVTIVNYSGYCNKCSSLDKNTFILWLNWLFDKKNSKSNEKKQEKEEGLGKKEKPFIEYTLENNPFYRDIGIEKEIIEEYFYHFEGRNKTESFLYFYSFGRKEIEKIKINGKGIKKIAYASGFDSKYLDRFPWDFFHEWLRFFFGEEYKDLASRIDNNKLRKTKSANLNTEKDESVEITEENIIEAIKKILSIGDFEELKKSNRRPKSKDSDSLKPIISDSQYLENIKVLYESIPELREKGIGFQSFFVLIHKGEGFYKDNTTEKEVRNFLIKNGILEGEIEEEENLELKELEKLEKITRPEVCRCLFDIYNGTPLDSIKYFYNLQDEEIKKMNFYGLKIEEFIKLSEYEGKYRGINDYKKFINWAFGLD